MATAFENEQQTAPGGVGHSASLDAAEAARTAIAAALGGRTPTHDDLVLLFPSAHYDIAALHAAALTAAGDAMLVGCTSTGGVTHVAAVPQGCVAAYLPADGAQFGVAHLERDDADIAGTARRAAELARDRAGDRNKHSVLMVLTDGLTPDQREVARGVYEVTSAVVPLVGGSAGDDLNWAETWTFGDGKALNNGIVAVWIDSPRPVGVSVGHGWRPAGRPMLVTRAEGTVIHELDGGPALDCYIGEHGGDLSGDDPEFFHHVLAHPVGLPNIHGRYEVRQLHAYLPEGGGLNFNTGMPEQTVLQIMSSDSASLIEGAREAAAGATRPLDGAPRIAIVFSCGSRVPLLGERIGDEVAAVSESFAGAPVCGFFTFGEFARVTGSTGVHNSSVAVLAL
jgi:hypothetical protein